MADVVQTGSSVNPKKDEQTIIEASEDGSDYDPVGAGGGEPEDPDLERKLTGAKNDDDGPVEVDSELDQ